MAHNQNPHPNHARPGIGGNGLLADIGDRYRRYRVYRHTLNELQALGPRELSDLGLNRSMVHACAYRAAYEDQ